jgi:hypothetical protein
MTVSTIQAEPHAEDVEDAMDAARSKKRPSFTKRKSKGDDGRALE